MNSRERVFRALEFRFPDRAPRNLWALDWVRRFAAEELAAVEEDFPEDLVKADNILGLGDRCRGKPNEKGTYTDEWGCVWECGQTGILGEVKGPPLADYSALAGYTPPWEVIERAAWDTADRLQEENLAGEKKFLYCWSSVRPFERMQFLRGTEKLMMDLAYGTAEVRVLLRIVHTYNLKLLEGWAKTDVDGLGIMDDWGSQQSLLISPAMWREIYKPLYQEYFEIIHSAGKKVFFHSDGYIIDIYEDLIEIGVDAINSQLFCMDIEEISRRFKGQVTFWGELDRQQILPFGTVEDVRRAVGRVRRALDDQTGGVIAQCEWGPDNPADNIRAVFEAWKTPIEQLP